MIINENRDRVNIEMSIKSVNTDWDIRLFALGDFLLEYEKETKEKISIFAYEDENIGGLRLSEVSFFVEHASGGISGSSYQRCEESHAKFILHAEKFLETYGLKPYRPDGWKLFINDHGDARISLLRCMGKKSAANKEYKKQLKQEELFVSN